MHANIVICYGWLTKICLQCKYRHFSQTKYSHSFCSSWFQVCLWTVWSSVEDGYICCPLCVIWYLIQGQSERLLLHQSPGSLCTSGGLWGGGRFFCWTRGSRGRCVTAAPAWRQCAHDGGNGASLQRQVLFKGRNLFKTDMTSLNVKWHTLRQWEVSSLRVPYSSF